MSITQFNFENLKPKYQDQDERYNNWYFTVHFTHEGRSHVAKFAITEGTLLGQYAFLAHSHAPLTLRTDEDVEVLRPSPEDINQINEENDFAAEIQEDEVIVTLGDLRAICREDVRRVIATDEAIQADLTFTPRGPLFNWGHESGAVCSVTEATRVSGCESLSLVNGTLTVNGQTYVIEEGCGLFERVWFGQLNFFEIRATDWLYAHFDELYVYFCRTESVTAQGRPFHFETGEAFLTLNNDFMEITDLEISPERWVFMEEARRFIPIEQSMIVHTTHGRLYLETEVVHYPQFVQPPMRMPFLTIDNISGWSTLFYDSPVAVRGKFKYRDGRTIQLTNGRGMNEQIRISPL